MATPKVSNTGAKIWYLWTSGEAEVALYFDGARCYNLHGQLTVSWAV